jgi:hypothetical protein
MVCHVILPAIHFDSLFCLRLATQFDSESGMIETYFFLLAITSPLYKLHLECDQTSLVFLPSIGTKCSPNFTSPVALINETIRIGEGRIAR